jgi:hypothetical protein
LLDDVEVVAWAAEEPAGGAVVVAAAFVVASGVVAIGEVAIVAGVVAGVVPVAGAPPEAGAPELPPAAVVAEPALLEGVLPTQLESVPLLMVKGADCATKPELSRRLRPIDVPAAMLTVHVKESPLCWPRSTRAAAVG